MLKKFTLLSLMLFIALIFTSACGSSGSGNCDFFGFPNTTPETKTITLSKYKFTLDVGTNDKIIAYVNGIDKTNEVKYTPIKEEFTKDTVATVENGLITAIKAGTEIFQVSYPEAESVTFTVTANDPTLPTLEVVKNEINLEYGTDPRDIESIIVTLNGKDVTSEATFISTNENVATVDENGNINIVGEGETQIVIHVDGANDQVVTIKITLPELEINKSNINLQVGQTEQLTVKLKDEDKTQNAVYQSSDLSVATVDKNGKITAVGEGTATITIAVEGAKNAEITVNVYDPEKHKITCLPKSNMYETEDGFVMYKGETGNITVLVGGVDKTEGGVYTPADETIVKVDNENEHGKMYALEIGTTSINLHHEEALEGDVKVNVIVKPKPNIEEDSFEMLVGNNKQIVVKLNGTPVTGDCTFTTDSNSIATVDTTGKVTAKGVGTTTVYASYDDGIRVHKFPVTVSNSTTLDNNQNGISSTLLIDEERQQMLTILMDTGMISNENDIQDIVQIDDNGMTEIVITIDREDGQKVAVVVYKEENGKQIVKYISTETVQSGEVTVNVGSSPQNIVAQENSSGTLETIVTPGFYNANDQLLASWELVTGDKINGGALVFDNNRNKVTVSKSKNINGVEETVWGWNYATDWPNQSSYYGTAGHLCTISNSHSEIKNATKLVIPDGITGFGNFTFDGLVTNLNTIVFPNTYSRENLGLAMTRIKSNMTNYTIRSDNSNFDSIDGIIYSEDHYRLLVAPLDKNTVNVPEPVTTLTQDSCVNNKCNSIGPSDSKATFKLPNTINTFVLYSCSEMPNLKWVELPSGLTINPVVFYNCNNLKKIYIPKNTTIVDGTVWGGTWSMFGNTPSDIHVYCEDSSQPSTWSSYWNARAVNGGNRIPSSQIHWNVTREWFRANCEN